MKIAENFPPSGSAAATSVVSATIHDENPLSYRPEDGALQDFGGTQKGSLVRRQYRQGAESLKRFLTDSAGGDCSEEISALDRFASNVEQGSSGFFAAHMGLLYCSGKERFDAVCNSVRDDRIPLHTRVSEIKSMAAGLLCAPGSISNVMVAAERLALNAAGGINSTAQHFWLEMLDDCVGEFARRQHANDPYYVNNEIHYCNAYRNFLSDRFRVEMRPDDLIDSIRMEIGPEQLASCGQLAEQRMTAAQLVRNIAEACLQDIHAHCSCVWPDRPLAQPLDEAAAWALHQNFQETLAPQLRFRYGDIDVGVLVTERDGASGGDDCYAVVEGPTLLMHAIARNLRAAGVLQHFKMEFVVGRKGDPHTVKRVGDALYVKSRETGSRRPLVIGNLPRHDAAQGPELLLTAIDNERDSGQLRGLDPEEAWHRLGGQADVGPADLMERFMSASVRRYRGVASGHDARLIELLVQSLHGLSPGDRHGALLHGLANGEDGLATALLRHVEDIDLADPTGNLVVHYAASFNCPGTLNALVLERPERINAVNFHGNTPLMLACERGHVQVVGQSLACGAAVDAQDGMGNTALMFAAPHELLVARLVARGAKVDLMNSNRDTALHFAARGGQRVVIEILANGGARIDATNAHGDTPLHISVDEGHAAATCALLDLGADIEAQNSPGFSPLRCAARSGHVDIVGELISRGCTVDATNAAGATALMFATRHGHLPVIEVLRDNGSSIAHGDRLGDTALIVACEWGQVPAVELLIRFGASVNAANKVGRTGLMHAALNGNLQIIGALLEAGALVETADDAGHPALMHAVDRGQLPAIAALRDAGADLEATDEEGMTALMHAAESGATEIIEFLIRRGASVHATDKGGFTAFLLAADAGRVSAMDILLRSGSSIEQADHEGNTALLLAARNGDWPALEFLLGQGALVDTSNKAGLTAWMLALMDDDPDVPPEVVDLLCAAKADIEAADESGCTALMHAAGSGNLLVVDALLRHGASIDVKDTLGNSAVQRAETAGHVAVMDVFRRWRGAGSQPPLAG